MLSLESRRAAKIAENAILLDKLQIKHHAERLRADASVTAGANANAVKKRKANAARNDESNQPLVRRRSFRIQGVDASSGKDLHVPSLDPDAAAAAAAKRAEDYFDADVKATAIVVTGHFNGWVASDVCKRHGIAADAASAWESSGSGSAGFSRSNPLGLTSKAAIAAAGKLSAKEIASRLLKKNPNSYFYRHVEPSESQAMGQDWEQSEIDMFLKVAREHGCGDKWGLFASYVPRRVGYQCSNFYRSYILPRGLVFDPNYRITADGNAVYVGNRGSNKQ